MSIEQIAGLTGLAASLAFLIARFFINRKPRNPQAPKHDAIYSKLLTKTQGDHGKANRLIEFERRKNPTASKSELMQEAIERLENDMGR